MRGNILKDQRAWASHVKFMSTIFMKYLAFLGADIWVWMWPLVKCLRCKSFKLQSQATPAAMNTVLRLKPSVLPLPFWNRAKLQQTKVSLRILFRELVLVFQKLTCNRQPYSPKWQDSHQCNSLVWAVTTLISKNHGSFCRLLIGVLWSWIILRNLSATF